MPKVKKFVDGKSSVTFHVVHRSQHDPLIADETAPQRVLVPVDKKSKGQNEGNIEKRKEEQRKYGIFFDDDYNYLQHLRKASEVIKDWDLEAPPVREKSFPPKKGEETNSLQEVKIHLPSSVFASNVEESVGMLNKAAPHSGLRLDIDPDVVAAMDEDFDFDNPDNQLEDNFMELANVEGCSEEDSNDGSEANSYEFDSEGEDDEVCSLRDGACMFEDVETKSRFTNYSMSSSVIRRNDQLMLLDERFEQLFADYDESEIGALDSEEIEGYLAPNSDIVLQCAEEFEKQYALQKHETERTMKLAANLDSEDETDVIEVPEKSEKWDCESILSTYSNLYNHPKLIMEPKVSQRIRVSARTGMPLNVLDGSGNKLTVRTLAQFDASTGEDSRNNGNKSVISALSSLSIRPKNETIEEKRERKKGIKEYRKVRRVERRLNTETFKEEKKRQEKILLANKNNLKGVKIL